MIIEALTKEIRDALLKDEFFSNVTVIDHHLGNVDSEVEVALAKIGLAAIIEPAVGKVKFPGIGNYAMDASVTITVVENVLINQQEGGTGKTAQDVIEHIFEIFNPASAGAALVWLPESFELLNDTEGYVAYQVKGIAQLGWKRKEG